MRQISKRLEPRSLTVYRASSQQATYEGYREKQELREQLAIEQRGLCCYCLCRIRSGEVGNVPPMKIAHWHSQHLHPGQQLDYMNLLGACMGNQGSPPELQHCDTRQGDQDIKFNPADPNHRIDNRIRYLEDGTIESDDEEFNEQIENILNLNAQFLKQHRRESLQNFLESLGTEGLKRQAWERILADRNGDSHRAELEPFCQIVIFWLRRRLARA